MQQRKVTDTTLVDLESTEDASEVKDRKKSHKIRKEEPGFGTIFRAAHFLGLFPVSGMGSGEIEFKPLSLKLIATVLFIIAVLVLEGLGLVHMLIVGRKTSNIDLDNFYRQGTIAADLAPVLHYGATVRKFTS